MPDALYRIEKVQRPPGPVGVHVAVALLGHAWPVVGMLLFDYRYGLFVTGPILLLALGLPWLSRRGGAAIPRLEQWALLGIPLVMVLFFGGNNYTRLQFNTGIRYLAPVLPFLFVPAAIA